MNENPADDQRATDGPAWEAPHADRTTLRPAYAFDGSGPYLYGPDGSGPYAYTPDGRGPYLLGSSALGGSAGPAPRRPRGPPERRRRTTRGRGVPVASGS